MELCSMFHLQTVMTNYNDPGTVQFYSSASQNSERHRKGVSSIGPYVTQLARHFGLLHTAAQESSLTLIGQTSPQAPEDITDDVLPQHEDPPSQPPPPSRPVHICQHLHISLPPPPREPSSDEDV
ncbi:hypothetical protein GOBAR_AA07488 [Gossypium barbadense]|uniref:Uncharacterized protein n=1 Tax=Gossypium barbadense TaxID=3634 RepID=A0A2P5YC16_GOSBA|nr:hypothetical protein GOBAR_AA07488 [Gossypium barbadense]